MSSSQQRPIVTELRLSAFKSHRGATFALEPITLLTGASGTGKSSALEGLALLGRLASGAELQEIFSAPRGRAVVRGGAAACVPQGARPDGQGRRGFRLGCTTNGPLGPVRLDLAVQVEPTLRIVGERLTGIGETLLTTALRDPARPMVQAAWHTAGAVPVTRAPLPDNRLATSLLPLRVSGRTEGQRLVLAAVEQTVVALRGVFPIAPRPELMRGPVQLGDGRLRSACDNLSAVLARTEGECGIRHGMLVNAMRAVCAGPVEGLTAIPARLASAARQPTVDGVIAAVDRGAEGKVPIDRLGDGELRFLALALVLLTGPGVLDVDTSTELLPAGQVLTVVADGLDLGVDRRQAAELLRLARVAAARGHIRLLATVQDPECAGDEEGVSLEVVGEDAVGTPTGLRRGGEHRVPVQARPNGLDASGRGAPDTTTPAGSAPAATLPAARSGVVAAGGETGGGGRPPAREGAEPRSAVREVDGEGTARGADVDMPVEERPASDRPGRVGAAAPTQEAQAWELPWWEADGAAAPVAAPAGAASDGHRAGPRGAAGGKEAEERGGFGSTRVVGTPGGAVDRSV
ncbi:AAA family ATPase [Actinacidiphila yeochonensis]|uniref:AAA family ATPase n=1 Tax=Actinacidiphila yeochonensis TaxID=89050 RepID=UPI0007C664C0|nr:ATP-binding protein [Actinacidiphila yeochonensis]